MTNPVRPGSSKQPPIAKWGVSIENRSGGSMVLEPDLALGPYPDLVTDSLDYWASVAPDRTFLAERAGDAWRTVSFAEMRRRARAVGRWLADQGLSEERPLAILSGNDIRHAELALGAMYAGAPYSAVSPAYSLISTDFGKLRHVMGLLTPGMVFAGNPAKFARAMDATMPADARRLGGEELDQIASGTMPPESPIAAVRPDSIAKILFTSGSSATPKGVITTHRMLTSNQEMLRTVFPFFRDEPLTICDWLPWNHTFGGSHNFGIALYNGGTIYLDAGRPVPGLFDETVRNLREIAPTVYFNVPKGFEMLVEHLRRDRGLRDVFYSRLRMNFFAAAGLSKYIWDALDELAIETLGHKIPMLTGLGATETSPFAVCANAENTGSGAIGLPVPGVRMKLAPVGYKLEARFQGPNVTPGFWRQEELTRNAFDEEGFYRMGDAVRFRDPDNPALGLLFDGRISEDFKLSSGTWVSVGPLRTRLILHFAPLVKDAVIVGQDRDEVTALLFPDPQYAARLREEGGALLESFAASATGSSNRVVRALIAAEPPSLDAGELTDKGSVNPAAVLARRADVVEWLYREPFAAGVLRSEPAGLAAGSAVPVNPPRF
ncbi:MAG: feruloyl-CoA synthase [Acidobacteriota bacterium]|nr:feruloyl-CoA synthase [Acidobacteriota bacterium]